MWLFTSNAEKFIALTTQRDKVLETQQRMLELMEQKFASLEQLVFDLQLKLGPSDPVRIVITGENAMADLIQFKIVLPPKSAPDVAVRELTVTIGDGTADIRNLSADASVLDGLEGAQGATVSVSLVDVDDQGNRSSASTASLVLTDNVAPPQPGEIGLEITGETHVDDAPTDPPADPAV